MNSEKGFSTLLMVGIMAMFLMVFGVTLFATKPTPPLSSHAAEITVHQVSLPAVERVHTSALISPQPTDVVVSSIPGNGDGLDVASNDLDNENLDESKSDENEINIQSTSL